MANVYSCITANSDWWDGTESWGGETTSANRNTLFSTRNFTTLALWEADRDGNSSSGDTEYARLVGPFSSTITATLTIGGFVADAVVIEAPITLTDGQANAARHPGYVDASPDHYRVRSTSGHCFTIQDDVTFDGLDIENQSTGTSDECIRIDADGTTLTVKNVIGGFNSQNSEQDFIYTNGNSAENLGTITLEQCQIWNCERAVIDLYDGNGAETYNVEINSCHFYNIGDGHRSSSGNRGGIIGQGASNSTTVNYNIRNTLTHFDSTTGYPFCIDGTSGTRNIDQCVTSENDWDNLNGSETVTNSATGHTWATTDQGAGDYVIIEGVKDLRIQDLGNTKNEAQDRHSTATAISVTIPSTDIVGTSRPQNTNYDLGAFEISSSTEDTLTAVSVSSATTVSASSVGQKHALTSTSVVSASTVSTPAIGQAHALTVTDVESASEVSAPTVSESHVLTSTNVESASNVTNPAIGQTNALTATDAESASNVSTPALGQEHTLASTNVESASSVSTPTILQSDALTSTDVESASNVSASAIGQAHSLISANVESASNISTPDIGQVHALTSTDIESASVVSSPTIGAASDLSATGIQSSSTVSAPAIGQEHALTAVSVQSSTAVTSPTISTGGVNALTATAIQSASSVSVPDIGQEHTLTAVSVESESEVYSYTGVQSGSSVSTSDIAQVHALSSVSVQSAAEVTAPTISTSGVNALTATDVSSTSSVNQPAIGQIHVLTDVDIESSSEVTSPTLSAAIYALVAESVKSASELASCGSLLMESGDSLLLESGDALLEEACLAQLGIYYTANDAESSSEVSSPSIGQTHALTANNVESSTVVSFPELGGQTTALTGSFDKTNIIKKEIFGIVA